MFITSAKPEDVLRWFKNADHGQEILCILLANEDSITNKSENSKSGRLVSLIRNYSRTDVSLGNRIALLVFHAQASRLLELPGARNERKVICAENLLAPQSDITMPLREVPVFKDISEDSFARSIILSNETAESTLRLDAEFVNLLRVDPKTLPAICTFVQGIDDVVIKPLGADWAEKDVQTYFLELQTFLTRLDAAPLPPPLGGALQACGHLSDLITSIDANKKKLDTVLLKMAKKADLEGAELEVLNQFTVEENGTTEAVQSLFTRLQSIDFSVAAFKERQLKCLRLAGRIDSALDVLRTYHVDRLNETEALRKERVEQRRDQVVQFVNKLSATHGNTKLGASRDLPVGFWTALVRAKDLMDIAKHISDFLKP
jgi:hypothetical protein